MLLASCGGDNVKKGEELPPEKQAYYDEQAKKNQSNDHEGHNHTTDGKPTAIENNSRVAVPVDKNTPPPPTGQSGNQQAKTKAQMQREARQNIQVAKRKVPDACSLISDKDIADVIGIDEDAINIKDGSSSSSPYARSCFFRWDHRGIPNSGVLLQVQDNPVPDEFPEWAAYFIQAKKTEGEKSPDGSFEFKFEDFKGLGVDGAYSFELNRYLWRDKNDYVYLIAFNLPATEAEELEWARKIGAEVMKNVKY